MGLPIWRVPDDKTSSKDAAKNGPPMDRVHQSRIRRRPSIHGLRSRARATRDHHNDSYPPRLTRSPPLSHTARESRRSGRGGVPPISTLLESADSRALPPPPPPVPESRNYYASNTTSSAEEAQVVSDQLTALNSRRARAEGEETARPGFTLFGPGQSLTLPSNSSQMTFTRSPEPVENQEAPQPVISDLLRTNLPTPPLDHSPDSDGLFQAPIRSNRPSHPLANVWRPVPPLDGLGDRNRSPTPADAWEVIRTTITPDATLPSADSSFASGVASQSFASTTNDTPPTEPEVISPNISDYDSQSDSVSSVDPDDLCADDESRTHRLPRVTDSLAREMYFHEMESPRGRERIAAQERLCAREGNRFTLEARASLEIGLRLLEDALSSEEGAQRILDTPGGSVLSDEYTPEEVLRALDLRARVTRDHQDVLSTLRDEEREVLSPSDSPRRAPPHYPRRTGARHDSPPHQDTETSTAAPEAHPVSPPNQRSQNEISSTMLLDPDLGEDLDAMRRVVERLASRDDVPDEWWMSMGLNLSRARPRSLDARQERRAETDLSRVRGGRVERSRDGGDRRPRL